MVRMLKRVLLVTAMICSMERASGFALLGPFNEAYQVTEIGYTGLGGPKNLGEEYRVNRPVVFYAANQNFLDYFGSNGLNAVTAAFDVFNTLTNVSSYDASLSDAPLETMRENYHAQALGLLDVKSETMTFIVKQLGLAEPERYVWTLHNRFTAPGGQCPQDQIYDVIKRNFDFVFTNPDQLQPSSYVNGTLYSYLIFEVCTGAPILADAEEFAVDPTANTFTAVASEFNDYGNFYTGLTRDDIAGLRYLLRTNNYNFESTGIDTIAFITNNTTQLLFTSNLTELVSAALTNDAAGLLDLFPNIQILATTPIFTNVVTTNFFSYFTNHPGDPYGTVRLINASQITTNVETHYSHLFGNVYLTPTIQLGGNLSIPFVAGHSASNGFIQLLTTNIGLSACPPGSPYTGQPCTNVTFTSVQTNGVFGDYFILPTNLCSVSLVSTQLIRTVSFTNTITATNATGVTNIFNDQFSQSTIQSFNQYIYLIRPVVCPVDAVGLRQGVERIQFVRKDYDSLLNRFFYPVTNEYNHVILTNNTLTTQRVRRVITEPDLLIDAQDLAPGPSQNVAVPIVQRSILYDESNINPNLAGPGVLQPGASLIFNKVGPIYENSAPDLLDEAGQILWFIWGSFDGTTNAPVVYPNGTDILNIENQVLIQLSPTGPALPPGTIGVNYTMAFGGFTVSGNATPPFQWSIPFGSGGLPPGLSLHPNTGQIMGLPTTPGTYDFTIRMTDAVERYVDREYTIVINP